MGYPALFLSFLCLFLFTRTAFPEDAHPATSPSEAGRHYSTQSTDTHLTYDGLDRVISSSRVLNDVTLTTTYHYEGALLKWIQGEDGRYTVYHHYALARIVEQVAHATDELGTMDGTTVKTTSVFDSAGRVVQVRESQLAFGERVVTSYTYDSLSRIKTKLDSVNKMGESYDYDIDNNKVTVTTTNYANGSEVVSTRVSESSDDGSSTKTSNSAQRYNEFSSSSVNDRSASQGVQSGGKTFASTTTSTGLAQQSTSLTGVSSKLKRDLDGNRASLSPYDGAPDTEKNTWRHGFDGEMLESSSAFGASKNAPTGFGTSAGARASDGIAHAKAVNEVGETTQLLENGRATGFKDDPVSHTQWMWRDGKGYKITQDARGRMIRREVFVGFTSPEAPGTLLEWEGFTHDQNSNIKTHRGLDGAMWTYSFDQANRLVEVSCDGVVVRTFSDFDRFNQARTLVENGVYGSIKTTRTYDDKTGELLTESTSELVGGTGVVPKLVGFLNDDFGRLAKLTYPSGREGIYTYEGMLGIDKITFDNVLVADMSYDPATAQPTGYSLTNNSDVVSYNYKSGFKSYGILESITYKSERVKTFSTEQNRPFLSGESQWTEPEATLRG